MSGSKYIFATQTTDTKTSDVEGVGRLRWEDDSCFRWVKNPTTNYTPTQGDVVCHQFTDGISTTNGVLTTALMNIYKPVTATLGFMAGVVCGLNWAASTGTNPAVYGWIQVKGPCTLATITTASAAGGNSLIAVNGQTYVTAGSAVGTAPTYARRLAMLDTTGAAATGNVTVECL